MSRVYWHSLHGEAELHGSERMWLAHIVNRVAAAAWDIGDEYSNSFEHGIKIMEMLVPGRDHYLQEYLEKALAQERLNHVKFSAAHYGGDSNFDPERRFMSSLRTCLRVGELELLVAGHRLSTSNIELNTALAVGTDVVALAAKIHGWCETHCYIEGVDREWVADIIDEGLSIGIYRQGLWYDADYHQTAWERRENTNKKWVEQGWDEVTKLLRSRNDEPVVLSYSVTDSFPDEMYATDFVRTDEEDERWYDLSSEERWALALSGLRTQKPWARISPQTLRSVTFHAGVTIYDLFAPDRDERVKAAFANVEAEEA